MAVAEIDVQGVAVLAVQADDRAQGEVHDLGRLHQWQRLRALAGADGMGYIGGRGKAGSRHTAARSRLMAS